MAGKARVWVVVDLGDPLDRALLEALEGRLADSVEVEARPRRQTWGTGVADRLRAALDDVRASEVRRVASELTEQDAPEVVVVTHPADASVFAEVARRGGPRPVRVGVCRSPAVDRSWVDAPEDLLAVIDGHAASTAAERGPRARVTGLPLRPRLRPAHDAPGQRAAAGLAPDAHVVLVPTDVIDGQERVQLLVQLSLVRASLEVLFEVGDAEQAEQVRVHAPAHGIGASLLPTGEAGAELWSLAHLVLGRARPLDLGRARAVGAPLAALQGGSAAERAFGEALVASGAGRTLESLATLAVDLDLTLEPERFERLAARQRELWVEEPDEAMAAVVLEALERREDLVGAGPEVAPGLERVSRPRRRSGPPAERFDDAAHAATEVRDRAELWEQRARLARERGEGDLAVEAEKRAARHREALARLLDRLRPEGWREGEQEPSLEEELEAMRRQAIPDGNVEARLRSLEVEDELRALKERLLDG